MIQLYIDMIMIQCCLTEQSYNYGLIGKENLLKYIFNTSDFVYCTILYLFIRITFSAESLNVLKSNIKPCEIVCKNRSYVPA